MTPVLLVTGGASGIGAAAAQLASSQGYAVAINYRTRRARAEELARELSRRGPRAAAFAADVSEFDQVQALYHSVEAELGPLRAVINSAGVVTKPSRVADVDPPTLERMLRTNVLGVMYSCREAARRMSTHNGGAGGVILNVSSMAATIGGRPGSSHYAASKAAVDCFSVGFAKEVAREGIRVISLRPGFTITDMTRERAADPEFARTLEASIPLGRPAHVDEVASPLIWLLSSAASFITGTTIDVSGGGFQIAD